MDKIAELRKPEWIKTRLSAGVQWRHVDEILARRRLHTVCDEAKCPNKGECWGRGTATFMILGDVCTRGCRFCAVATARQGRPVLPDEPEQLAAAVEELDLKYAVLTSVDRDDLEDRGSGHFAACIRAIRSRSPAIKIEALIPDFAGAELEAVAAAAPDVLAHNVETVRRLQRVRDARASFDKSLATLSQALALGIPVTKSSIMLGLGETRDEVLEAMRELKSAGVDVLVLGQYLRPSPAQVEVAEYVTPDAFRSYAGDARAMGFSSVVSAPFARTSYHAMDAWEARKGSELRNSREPGDEAIPRGAAEALA